MPLEAESFSCIFTTKQAETERYSCWQDEWRPFTKQAISPGCAYWWGQRLIAASCFKRNNQGVKSHSFSNSSHYLLCECEYTENNLRKILGPNKSMDIKHKRNFQLLHAERQKNQQGREVRIFFYWPDVDESQTKYLLFIRAKTTISD